MSSNKVSDDLRNWIEDLDTGQHYTDSNVYRNLVFRQNKLSAREHRFDQPVLVPEGRFEELVCFTQNHFVKLVSDGEDHRLQELEELLPKRLESLTGEIEELTTRIESLCRIRDRFHGLDSRFETLDGAAEENELPESILRHGAPDGISSQESKAVYDASRLFDNEVRCPIYRGDRSPLRVAAHARMPLKNLRERRLGKRKAWSVGKLRLRILQYVLARLQITGFPPKKLSLEGAAEEAENAREEAKNTGGRPGDVAEGRDIEERYRKLDEWLEVPAFWKIEDGEPIKPDYSAIYESGRKEHADLFLPGKSAIRKNVKRNFDLDLKRKKVRENLQKTSDSADKPSGQT